uniref:SFRICE_013801 n=1 Tax=Spodoptera frugiperda TaxID=7108 RepID=A0A2H1VKP6_SPOFR
MKLKYTFNSEEIGGVGIFVAINFTAPETFLVNAKPWKLVRAFWSYSIRKEVESTNAQYV